MVEDFGRFGEWLIETVGPHRAALTIHRYLAFFQGIEKRWQCVPGYIDLLGHFGAEGLRRARLPMQWLQNVQNIVPNAVVREANSERRRIEGIAASVPKGTRASSVMESYSSELMSKVEAGRMTLRSARLALRPAASLLLQDNAADEVLPNQQTVDRYLAECPGQKAALTGFLNFLRRRYGIALQAKVDGKRASAEKKKKLERALIDMTESPENDADWSERWVLIGLEYFHGKRVGRKQVHLMRVREEDGGLLVDADGESYWIPKLNRPWN